MVDLFQSILVEAEALPVPSPTRRDVVLPALPGEADAVVGMRRVGKSWLLLRAVRDLFADQRLHITITGSSAKLLGKEIATSMRGRSLTTEESGGASADEVWFVPGGYEVKAGPYGPQGTASFTVGDREAEPVRVTLR